MTSATGNSKRQAERNAGVEGLRFLVQHPELLTRNNWKSKDDTD